MTQEREGQRERFNTRSAGRWLGWQSSFDGAEQTAGVTFAADTTSRFWVIVCGDGSDARIYPKGKQHGP